MDKQQQQQQPLKKQKIDNNSNKESKILKQIKFDDLRIINFIKIYNLYEKYPQNDSVRWKSVEYFNTYHRNKIPEMIDVDGYIKFIVNVFFDPCNMIFNEIIILNNMGSRDLLDKIIETIMNDKRFNHFKKYEKRLEILEKVNNIKRPFINTIDDDDDDDSNEIIKKENNDNNKVIYKKEYNLPNLLIYKIIDFIFSSNKKKDYDDDYDCINREIYNYSLVSKQFIKELSKYFINNPPQQDEFPTLTPIEDTNTSTTGNSNWRLSIQSPLMFDYEWVKFIKYSWSVNQIISIFSKVETFIINSDECDIKNEGYSNRQLEWYNKKDFKIYGEYYRYSIDTEVYLIHPPPMPSLKSLIIKDYHGYMSYSQLLSRIIKSNRQSINHFYISINLDDESETNYNEVPFIFFNYLFKYHSNTLNSIEINLLNYQLLPVLNIFEIFSSCSNEFKERVKLNLKFPNNNDIDILAELMEEEDDNEELVHYLKLFEELKLFLKNQK